MPLRFLVNTAITIVTSPVVVHGFLLLPPSHRMRGATALLVRHKPQWHRHDRRSSAVVPSLIAVAPPKTVKTADLRGGTAETFNMFRRAEPRRSWRCHWGLCGTKTAVAPRLRCDGGIMS